MKKFLMLVGCAFTAGPLLAAASTCETRVDKVLDKSTGEKVAVCLTEPPETTDDKDTTKVIITDTHEVLYPKRKAKKQAPAQKEIKVYTQEPISREYLDSAQYPSFHNDVYPRMSKEPAHESALQAIRAQKEDAKRKAEEKKRKEQAKKKKKAARKMKKQTAVQQTAQQPVSAQPAETYNPSYTGTYSQPTPSAAQAQIQQAQALQNDPLYQDNTAGGTTPDGFLQGGVMEEAGFGYNATDPAFQP